MTTKIKTVLVAMLVGGIGAVQAAETYYVDGSRETDAGDGKSELTAKKYIQSAVALCENDDTVVILPGVYDEGATTPSGAAGSLPARVKIAKRITLTSRDGRDSVFICGQRSSETTYGAGSDAVRGIVVTADGAGTVIEKVTVCNGATWTSDSKGAVSGYGGGIYCEDTSVYICDCTISNCTAFADGGLHCGTAARCWFTRNEDSGARASAAAYSRVSNCIFSHNSSGKPYLLSRNGYVINCTIVDNNGGHMASASGTTDYAMLNCLSVDNSYGLFSSSGGMATNCVVSEGYPRYAVGGRVSSSRSVRQVVSPAADDYRLLPTSDAIGYADGRLLAERTSDLPERYRNRDYFGNPIPVDGTPINCGAVQTVVPVQATGFLKLASGVVVKGHGVGLRADSHYVSSAEFPSQVEIDYAGAGELLCYTNSRIAFNAHVPKIGRTSAWITMPPTSVTEVEINPVMASQVVYADEKNGSDAYDGTSATVQGATVGPKKKLQDAIDAVTADFALVSVAPGTYAEGGMSGTGGLMSRVVIGKGKKYVFVRSSGSAEDTFITGAPDPTTHGLGAGATRCADLVSFAFLQGFTLTGGYSDDSGDDLRSKAAGVYCASTGSDCSVIDCIISNNTARSVAAAYYGRIVRSLVTENHVKGSNYCTLWNSVLVSSIIRRMSTIAYTLRSHSSLYNCTVAGLSSQTVATIIEANCNSYNTIYSECGAIPLNSGYNFKGCALWHSTMSPGPGASYTATTADPIFADETGLDFRPCELSGVLGVGGADLVSGDFYLRVGSDFNGNPLCFRNGQLTPGAVQTPCPGVVVATTLKDGIAVEGGRIGTNAVTEASAITVSATKSDTRPFVGFRVDGELLDHSITSLTLDESYGHKTVEAYYTTSWYVDAEHGNDEADGMTPATARLTFEKAMELPFAEKDTLHAARGRYAAGRMKQPQSSHYWTGDGTVELEARLWIDKNITVVADEGPDVTFIVGESAPADKADAYGLGRGALRCVVNTAYSTLKGFTLTGGRTLGASDVSGNDDDKGGAAYLSTIGGGNGALRNCVITNCTAVTGGAIVNAAAHQCKIVDVTATSGATAGYLSFFYGSYLDHLRGPGTILSFYRAFNSCTLGADCFDFEGRPAVFGNPNAATDKVINSIILSSALSNPNCFYDTVLIEGSGYTPSLLTNCHFVASAAAAGLDADGVPVPGSGSPALGNGNWSTYDESRCGTTDLAGKSRRSNNALDIGAYQSDWRAYYARRIGGRAMTCTEVSPTAQWTEQGLRLGDGDFIDLKLKEEVTASNPVSLLTCAAVTGTGILSVTTEKGTSEYTSADSPISYESEFTSGFANHRFAYAADSVDEGAAFVSRLKANVGMSLIIR